jgi:ribosome-associated protein
MNCGRRGAFVEIFRIEKGEHIELHDLLKVAGICSTGGAAKTAIAEGLVTVDGAVEQRKRCKLRAGQLVEYQGRKIQIQ